MGYRFQIPKCFSTAILLIWAASVITTFFAANELDAQDKGTDWKTRWDQILAAAKKEGEVAVAGPQSVIHREALTTGFKKAYPEIRLNFVGARSAEIAARIRQEREAGLYLWDVFIGGPTTPAQVLKPLGALAPLRPALILPEILGDKYWIHGFEAGWMDTEQKFLYGFGGSSTDMAYVNRDAIPSSVLSNLRQLLDPVFAGKIIMDDPRQDGQGLNTAFVFQMGYGDEFLRKLFTTQKITFSRDRRQQVEWVVRGKFPIAIAISSEELARLQDEGLGRSIMPLESSDLPKAIGTGNDAVGIMTNAPHPNAAIVYVNYLLSRSGQEQWSKIDNRNSHRTDVPILDPKQALQPGVKYIKTQMEKWLPGRLKVRQLAQELIP
jgi:iron(III) transport system substrate-binding protein